MKHLPFKYWPVKVLWGLATASCAVMYANTALAISRACQEQEQRYEQIKRDAGTVEINAALFSAANKGCEALAGRLLDDGASLEARDRWGARPLSRAAKSGETDIVSLFLSRGAPVDALNLDGSSALFIATETERVAVVKLLLEHGAKVDLPGRNGITPLAAAAYAGNPELVEIFLARGADAKTVDVTGKSALAYAAGRGFARVARLLLDNGVEVNARLGNDLTALMWAAGHSEETGSNDAIETIKILIDAGAHLDDMDNRGRTALMIAAELGHTAAADTLMNRGANRKIRDKAGKAAADLATDVGLKERLVAKRD